MSDDHDEHSDETPAIVSPEIIAAMIERLNAPTPEEEAGVSEVSLALALASCPTCGVVFAFPAELQIALAAKRGTVHCPNDHTMPAATGRERNAGFSMAYARLLAEFRQRTAELNRVKLRLARTAKAEPGGTITDAEFKRRSKIICNRAERIGNTQRRACQFCGGTYGTDHDLRRHLKTKHADDVTRLPMSYFD